MVWALIIVSWGMSLHDGVYTTVLHGYPTYADCMHAARIADQQHSTYDTYCIPEHRK
jgi:hypothetical protein